MLSKKLPMYWMLQKDLRESYEKLTILCFDVENELLMVGRELYLRFMLCWQYFANFRKLTSGLCSWWTECKFVSWTAPNNRSDWSQTCNHFSQASFVDLAKPLWRDGRNLQDRSGKLECGYENPRWVLTSSCRCPTKPSPNASINVLTFSPSQRPSPRTRPSNIPRARPTLPWTLCAPRYSSAYRQGSSPGEKGRQCPPRRGGGHDVRNPGEGITCERDNVWRRCRNGRGMLVYRV